MTYRKMYYLVFLGTIYYMSYWSYFLWIDGACFQNISRKDVKLIKRNLFSSPIVVPKYKLIFFWNEKAGCRYWKSVLQFIQGQSLKHNFVHIPTKSGLKYLFNYKDCDVVGMMLNTSWTKAVFVREPRERILSAYLDRGKNDRIMMKYCKKTIRTFVEFLDLIKKCKNVHWTSQVRLPKHFYKDFLIGKMSDIDYFTEVLLKKIGAWNDEIKKWLSSNQTNKITRPHATYADEKYFTYYNFELEKYIFSKFSSDYEVYGFEKKHRCSRKK